MKRALTVSRRSPRPWRWPAPRRHEPPGSFEARLIEQEHRTLHIWRNYLSRSQWPQGDARRSAALQALLWWFLAPERIAIGGAGVVAAVTAGLMWWQLQEMKHQTRESRVQAAEAVKQTTEMVAQNARLVEQIREQRSATLASQLTSYMPLLMVPDEHQRALAMEFFRFELERLRSIPEEYDLLRRRLRNLLYLATGRPACDLVKLLGGEGPPIGTLASERAEDVVRRLDCTDTQLASLYMKGLRLADAKFDRAVMNNTDASGIQCVRCTFRGTSVGGLSLQVTCLRSVDQWKLQTCLSRSRSGFREFRHELGRRHATEA
jgi:hypothetical protein